MNQWLEALKSQQKTRNGYSALKLEFMELHLAVKNKFRDYLCEADAVIKIENHPLSKMMTAKHNVENLGKGTDLSDLNFTTRENRIKLDMPDIEIQLVKSTLSRKRNIYILSALEAAA